MESYLDCVVGSIANSQAKFTYQPYNSDKVSFSVEEVDPNVFSFMCFKKKRHQT